MRTINTKARTIPQIDPKGLKQNDPGAKLDAGKPEVSLIFDDMPRALLAVAEIGTYGRHKYSKGGWKHVEDGIVYSRAYLEGRLCEADLGHYRREVQAPAVGARGLSSYPHPWLLPDFWQYPTGSMGLGPLQAIFQARFMKYLEHRGLLQAGARKVWGFFGDGEMDEPESIAALTLAARERVDNLVFVVNCNLQRLDGPVRGNGQIVQELGALFAGAGWNVIKVLWGSDWDALFARDATGALPRAFAAMVDGEFQTLSARDGRYNREHFFQRTPELAALVADWSDPQIERLHRGGDDLAKIHAAFAAARLLNQSSPVCSTGFPNSGMYGSGAHLPLW